MILSVAAAFADERVVGRKGVGGTTASSCVMLGAATSLPCRRLNGDFAGGVQGGGGKWMVLSTGGGDEGATGSLTIDKGR